MSFKVATLVYSRKTGSSHRKAILAYMADKASDNGGGIFCSKGTIAEETEIARSTVFKIVKELVAEGVLVELGHRACKNGHTVVYRMVLDKIRAFPEIGDRSKDDADQSEGRTSPDTDPSAIRTPLVRQPDPYQSVSRTQTILGTTLEQGGGGSAGARKPPADGRTEREDLLEAMGITSTMNAQGRVFGNMSDMAERDRWSALGLTHDQQFTIITEVMRSRTDPAPPTSFRYFTQAMQRVAADIARPDLQPTARAKGASHDRQRFDQSINALADRLSDGTAHLDTSSRDPWRT
ncbi:hypothetical protein [Falsirhodobacter halotolerans]|uniref:hypothetical protein n=1 Tax=Falsirhodobacter halotolerans TaxID=1146892 RepID=UPI001FD148F5|nr:hypothetical protein [Falsirhodobacter halotolerans]MCJ8139582.1 hypothetical protein [Falsirhodobacter halotolerans]